MNTIDLKKKLGPVVAAFITMLVSGCGKIEKDEVHDFKMVVTATDRTTGDIVSNELSLNDIKHYSIVHQPKEAVHGDFISYFYFDNIMYYSKCLDVHFDIYIDGELIIDARQKRIGEEYQISNQFVFTWLNGQSYVLSYGLGYLKEGGELDEDVIAKLDKVNAVLGKHITDKIKKQYVGSSDFKIVLTEWDQDKEAVSYQTFGIEDIESYSLLTKPEEIADTAPFARISFKNEPSLQKHLADRWFDFFIDGEWVLTSVGIKAFDRIVSSYQFVMDQSETENRCFEMSYGKANRITPLYYGTKKGEIEAVKKIDAKLSKYFSGKK